MTKEALVRLDARQQDSKQARDSTLAQLEAEIGRARQTLGATLDSPGSHVSTNVATQVMAFRTLQSAQARAVMDGELIDATFEATRAQIDATDAANKAAVWQARLTWALVLVAVVQVALAVID